MRTISLLIDDIGHKLLSTEAYDKTFAFSFIARSISCYMKNVVGGVFLYRKDSVNHNTRKRKPDCNF